MSVRVIPRLDIKGPNLVKGIHFEGLRVLGPPEEFARHYYEHGADELIYMDAVASLYGRNSLLEMVERTSREIFIPLTVGGGLRSVADIRAVLRAGADKVAVNTAAVRRPELIREASRAFGSSTVVVSIEAIARPGGGWEAYVDYGRQATGVDVITWALQAVELGAGELMVTSIDREGTRKGFDLELTREIATAVPVPVIAGGGASLLHYQVVQRRGHNPAAAGERRSEGNVEFLRRGGGPSRIESASIEEVKAALASAGVVCRPVARATA
jgi:imidazole glycerol-phosphate synthase subunit HisF